MSEHQQLDLRVVGGEERAVRPSGDEGAPDAPPERGADRDVLEVRGLARQPTGGCDGLVERRVDAAVAIDERPEAVRIGRAQLLDLAVLEDLLDDRMRPAKLLEDGCIGRVAGASPAAARELQ